MSSALGNQYRQQNNDRVPKDLSVCVGRVEMNVHLAKSACPLSHAIDLASFFLVFVGYQITSLCRYVVSTLDKKAFADTAAPRNRNRLLTT